MSYSMRLRAQLACVVGAGIICFAGPRFPWHFTAAILAIIALNLADEIVRAIKGDRQ